jgi:hypothetical protein
LPVVSVRYTFTQALPFPARDAFTWAVDYRPGDFALMGVEGRRRISKISDDAFLLNENLRRGDGVKRTKLVRIDPERMTYSSTHLSGPAKHSQFIYEILPDGKERSMLRFTGLLLYRSEKELSRKEVASIAAEERKFDSQIWKRLAKEMERDLRGTRSE